MIYVCIYIYIYLFMHALSKEVCARIALQGLVTQAQYAHHIHAFQKASALQKTNRYLGLALAHLICLTSDATTLHTLCLALCRVMQLRLIEAMGSPKLFCLTFYNANLPRPREERRCPRGHSFRFA